MTINMRDSKVYWIWAQRVFGSGSKLPWYIHRNYPGGLGSFYHCGPSGWSAMDYISQRQMDALMRYTIEQARSMLEYISKLNWDVLTPECEKYPQALRNISDPPAVLYVRGQIPDYDAGPFVAVAGARKASPDTLRAAKSVAQQLAAFGAVIVTGEAVGVDSSAISGAISACGRVVSLRAVDLLSDYPSKSSRLRDEIITNGGSLVTAEKPCGRVIGFLSILVHWEIRPMRAAGS